MKTIVKTVLFLCISMTAICQSINQVQFNTNLDLAAKTGGFSNQSIAFTFGQNTINDGKGGLYYFSDTAMRAHDGWNIIRTASFPSISPGRFIRQENVRFTRLDSSYVYSSENRIIQVTNKGEIRPMRLDSLIKLTNSGLYNTGVAPGSYEFITVNTKGLATSAYNLTEHNNSRVIGTAFRPSTDVDAIVTYSGNVSCNLSLSGGAEGYMYLQTSPTIGGTYTTKARIAGNGNTGTLTIGLNTTQKSAGSATIRVPKGYYVKIVTTTITGTPTYTLDTEQSEWY